MKKAIIPLISFLLLSIVGLYVHNSEIKELQRELGAQKSQIDKITMVLEGHQSIMRGMISVPNTTVQLHYLLYTNKDGDISYYVAQ